MESASPLPSVPPGANPWLSFPLAIVRTPEGPRLRIAWKVLAVQSAALFLTLWLLAATAGYCWIRFGQEFPGVQFRDVALPGRWPRLRAAWGDHFIGMARNEMKEQKWNEAIHHLRYGVARSPANTEGRLVLAQIFALMNKPDLAEQTLLAGVPFASDNVDFLKSVFAFLLQAQSDEEVIKIATRLLPGVPKNEARAQIIALAAATARYYRGDYDSAEDLVEQYQLRQTNDGRLLQVWIEWDRGFRDLALHRLANYIRDFSGSDEFYREMIRYQRQLGHHDQVEHYAVLRQIANPQNPLSHIDLMFAYDRAKNTARLAKEIDSYLADFAGNQPALIALADFAANTGNSALARRVFDQSFERKLGAEVCALMLIESHVVAGQHREAIALVEEFNRDHPEWFKNRAAVYNGLRAIAHFGLGQREQGELYLRDFLNQRNLRADNLVAVSNRLLALGEATAARRVLDSAVTADPRNQAALAKLVELDLQAGRTDQLAPNLQRLLTMRKPSNELLRRAHDELGSDRYLFATNREELVEALRRALGTAPAPAGG